jgi:hypothetical protein
MVDNFDKTLLDSPYEKEPRSAGPAKILIAVAVVLGVLVVAVIGFVAISGDEPLPDTASPDSSTTTAADSPPETIEMVSYDESPQLLIHPTTLPAGWTACAVSEDYRSADRFCDSDETSWVSVKFLSPESFSAPESTPTGIANGEWVSDSDPVEIHFPINDHYTAIVQSQGLDREQTLEVAASIPIVASRGALIGSYEVPIEGQDLTEADVAALFASITDDPTVDVGRFEIRVGSPLASLYAFRSSSFWTEDAATDLPFPRVIPADRPLVVGESVERNRAFAVWDQGGFGWRLEGSYNAEEISALALDIVGQVAAFPRITSP